MAVTGLRVAQGARDDQAETVLGVTLALFAVSAVFSLVFWKASRAERLARRPDRRVAEWRIDAGLWEAYRQRDAERARQVSPALTVFNPRKEVPATGVEVIAARNGFVIDDVFLGLEPRGLGAMTGVQWLSGRPECLEFAVLVPAPSTQGTLRTVPGAFRIPVAPASREAAALALAYYRALLEGDQLSDPSGQRLLVRIALLVALLLLPAGGIALSMAQAGQTSDTVLVVALLGLIGGGGALIVAFLVWAIMLKKR